MPAVPPVEVVAHSRVRAALPFLPPATAREPDFHEPGSARETGRRKSLGSCAGHSGFRGVPGSLVNQIFSPDSGTRLCFFRLLSGGENPASGFFWRNESAGASASRRSATAGKDPFRKHSGKR